jgi:hypothetical protein
LVGSTKLLPSGNDTAHHPVTTARARVCFEDEPMSAFAGAALSLAASLATAGFVSSHARRRVLSVNATVHHPRPIRPTKRGVSFSARPKRGVLVAGRAAADKVGADAVTFTFDTKAAAASKAKRPTANSVTDIVDTPSTDLAKREQPIDTSIANPDAIVADVLTAVADTDCGRNVSETQRKKTDADIELLEKIGTTQVPNALANPLIFGDYDVSYVSTGGQQIGNPAGGRFRGALGTFLFKTTGLEQNLYDPNFVVNRVAFLVFGLIPGEVVLKGTFEPVRVEEEVVKEAKLAAEKLGDETKRTAMSKKEFRDAKFAVYRANENAKYADDGATIRAYFDSPTITIGGMPALKIGPPSSVVLATTYLDENVRLGKGSRGSLFVFTRKTPLEAARDRKRWKVGGFGVIVMLCATALLSVFAVRRFKAFGTTELAVATAAAVAVSFAMALVMRQGGIVAEDADYEEKYQAQAERARTRALRIQQEKLSGGEK